ncbi:MAG: Putative phage-encoded peptidoglycan binding protein [uncultured Sulfurovum sp.]|uniref:Phage-encoded peptidoglycan binding protein n=1 Tax=uncultured Sulfurovum sp. TaxID=269237 RepID=A0A6S6SSE7_9BACT|nr:MAG: Putative phage-encoded peptidoglycan binding protein [uncultured Sulfurovum sp.]
MKGFTMYIITNFIEENRSKNNDLDVKQLQSLLNFLGESLSVDGDFGSKSTIATKKFQEKQGLQVDGQVGESTWLKSYEVSLDYVKTLIENEEKYDELALNSNNKTLIVWVQSILYLINNKTQITGNFDETLEQEIVLIQDASECSNSGCLDTDTWSEVFSQCKDELERVYFSLLTDAYILQRAEENDLSPAAVKAVVKVESNGRGFHRDGSLKILFEGHIFWKELNKVNVNPNNHVEGNKDILFKSYTKAYYRSSLQYGRLNKAKRIHKEAALKSASYGMFQVMGFNYKVAGFNSVDDFIASLQKSEKNQLEAFFNFVKNTKGCFKALQNKDWARFARIYNGPAYRTNQYDEKMERHYANSILPKSMGQEIDEEAYISHYTLELERAFSEFEA